jgi:hypothetical protein
MGCIQWMICSQVETWSWFMTMIFGRFVFQFCSFVKLDFFPEVGLFPEVGQCTQIPTENNEQMLDCNDDVI